MLLLFFYISGECFVLWACYSHRSIQLNLLWWPFKIYSHVFYLTNEHIFRRFNMLWMLWQYLWWLWYTRMGHSVARSFTFTHKSWFFIRNYSHYSDYSCLREPLTNIRGFGSLVSSVFFFYTIKPKFINKNFSLMKIWYV